MGDHHRNQVAGSIVRLDLGEIVGHLMEHGKPMEDHGKSMGQKWKTLRENPWKPENLWNIYDVVVFFGFENHVFSTRQLTLDPRVPVCMSLALLYFCFYGICTSDSITDKHFSRCLVIPEEQHLGAETPCRHPLPRHRFRWQILD